MPRSERELARKRKTETKRKVETKRKGREIVRLTRTVTSGGCAAKIGPGELGAVLRALPAQNDPRLLVGNETRDDAAVYRLRPDLALVTTVDFFPPMVDDPFTFGRIAAANALSDIYAMGGRPLVALNIVAFPTNDLPIDVLGRDSCRWRRARGRGWRGHRRRPLDLRLGAQVRPRSHRLGSSAACVRNGGAKAGDLLVLTKPLGTGVVATGLKRGAAEPVEEEAAIRSMVSLNDVAGGALESSSRARVHRRHRLRPLRARGRDGRSLAERPPGLRCRRSAAAARARHGLPRRVSSRVGPDATVPIWRIGCRSALDLAPGVTAAVVDPQTSGGCS